MSYAGRNWAEYDDFERERLGILNCNDAECSECKDENCPCQCHVRHEWYDQGFADEEACQ